jgi:hypothetical protein
MKAAVASLLLDAGADPNRPNVDGVTPLMQAAPWVMQPWCKCFCRLVPTRSSEITNAPQIGPYPTSIHIWFTCFKVEWPVEDNGRCSRL